MRDLHLLGTLSLALTGCLGSVEFRAPPVAVEEPPPEPDPDPNGAARNAHFAVYGQPVSARPVAAGGAVAIVEVQLLAAAPALATVASSDESVLSFALASQSGRKAEVRMTSGVPGKADLILFDSLGKQIDRATLEVAATKELRVRRGWGDGVGPTMLAGAVQAFHVTTARDAVVLVGDGAVDFTLGGPLRRLTEEERVDPATPLWPAFGDAISFKATARGQGPSSRPATTRAPSCR